MKNIFDELTQVINDFTREDGTIQPSIYDEIEGEDIEFSEALEELLSRHPDVKDYSVSTTTAFESCGYDCGIVSIAYVDKDGNLGHEVYLWEAM